MSFYYRQHLLCFFTTCNICHSLLSFIPPSIFHSHIHFILSAAFDATFPLWKWVTVQLKHALHRQGKTRQISSQLICENPVHLSKIRNSFFQNISLVISSDHVIEMSVIHYIHQLWPLKYLKTRQKYCRDRNDSQVYSRLRWFGK